VIDHLEFDRIAFTVPTHDHLKEQGDDGRFDRRGRGSRGTDPINPRSVEGGSPVGPGR
jgi:hypothetical protein